MDVSSSAMVLLGCLLVTGPDGRWHPGIGDPSFVGWLTVVAYAVAAFVCIRAALLAREARRTISPEAPWRARDEHTLFILWTVCALVMLLLGVNKQLDLQTWFTQMGRDLALRGGWYEERRYVQAFFIMAIIGSVVFGGLALLYLLRHVRARAIGTLLGLGLIVAFVVVRAASFHHVDALIGLRVFSLRVNWMLELLGISAVALSTYRQARGYGTS